MKAIGANYVYHYVMLGYRDGNLKALECFDVADSNDEAYGRAMKLCKKSLPYCSQHEAWATRIDHLTEVTRIDI